MTTTTRIQIGSALLLATLAACSTGPDTGVSVQLALCGGDDVCPGQEEQPPAEQPPQAPQVGCVLFMIRDVELEAGDSKVVDERPWEPVDLLDPDASAINLEAPAGTYERIKLKIEPLEGFATGPTGRKVSTKVCATIDGVAIEYRDDTYDTFELRASAGIDVADGGLARLMAVFDTRAWFDGVDPSALEVGADGIAYIDERNNKDWQNVVRDQIKDSVDLVRAE
ncbi:MAG: hypothetical protein KBG28_20660 [Kofleriaceae bacterium]|nr:hypothetical protein [Kofleriaceae bacterium]